MIIIVIVIVIVSVIVIVINILQAPNGAALLTSTVCDLLSTQIVSITSTDILNPFSSHYKRLEN